MGKAADIIAAALSGLAGAPPSVALRPLRTRSGILDAQKPGGAVRQRLRPGISYLSICAEEIFCRAVLSVELQLRKDSFFMRAELAPAGAS